eukprot:751789-Hanusia_phi.AAC.1
MASSFSCLLPQQSSSFSCLLPQQSSSFSFSFSSYPLPLPLPPQTLLPAWRFSSFSSVDPLFVHPQESTALIPSQILWRAGMRGNLPWQRALWRGRGAVGVQRHKREGGRGGKKKEVDKGG